LPGCKSGKRARVAARTAVTILLALSSSCQPRSGGFHKTVESMGNIYHYFPNWALIAGIFCA
jgi:hypothetical protein